MAVLQAPKRCSAAVWCSLVRCFQLTHSLTCIHLHGLGSARLGGSRQRPLEQPAAPIGVYTAGPTLHDDVQHSSKHCCSLVCVVVALRSHVSCILLCLHVSWGVGCLHPRGGSCLHTWPYYRTWGWQLIDRPPPFQHDFSHYIAPVGVLLLRYVTVRVGYLCTVSSCYSRRQGLGCLRDWKLHAASSGWLLGLWRMYSNRVCQTGRCTVQRGWQPRDSTAHILQLVPMAVGTKASCAAAAGLL